MCTYMLSLFLSDFSGLTVPRNPYCRAKIKLSVMNFFSRCEVTVLRCQNMALSCQWNAMKLNVSVCSYYLIYYFADDLTQNLPQQCFMLLADTDSQLVTPQPDVVLRWRQQTRDTPRCWLTQEEDLLRNVVTASLFEDMAQTAKCSTCRGVCDYAVHT